MSLPIIPFAEGEKLLDWIGLTEALTAGHKLPKAEIGDTFLYRGKDTLLSRSAWIDGMGIAVKSATIFPDNPSLGQPVVGGGVNLFSDSDGALEALVDFHLVTKWKTAGDSLLGALKLARKDSRKILIIGAGTVGRTLREAYGAGFPDAEFTIWNRTQANAEKFAASDDKMQVATNLEAAVKEADIITSATMVTEPNLKGAWLQEGQHVDLIGAYRPDMREVDDEALQRARIFVDSFDTTVGHIGEIKTPLETGAIAREHLLADYYEPDKMKRTSASEITLFKNGGGAHLDLMTSRYILKQWLAR
ncbi:NAD(P)-binding domain-containing protein [Lentibacter algarum]|uniref:ornithine cyclodeaminase family protein n=1 Tax=Lentibacter algarum TaxID=576131 RepID=UPI001C072E1F|nr:NAD(P)-binding domain-containing protein [Lentibacter algarum]MBU2981539.1 NAD(P)-binding domain-containing protein [Lentibacter algarum]